jgi:transglutaminase-like putative cysteine protease
MLVSLLRALGIAATLVFSLAVALAVGLTLARLGYLGTCQDGTCELVALVYVMPIGGLALYLLLLGVFSVAALKAHARGERKT